MLYHLMLLVLLTESSVNVKGSLAEVNQADEVVIQMERLPAETLEEESKLLETTDSRILAHVNNLISGLRQAGNAVNNAAEAVTSVLNCHNNLQSAPGL